MLKLIRLDGSLTFTSPSSFTFLMGFLDQLKSPVKLVRSGPRATPVLQSRPEGEGPGPQPTGNTVLVSPEPTVNFFSWL